MTDEMDYTVTLTAKELAFRERAREAGIPAIVVSMYAEALQRLVDKERPWVGLTDEEIETFVAHLYPLPEKPVRERLQVLLTKLRERNT